MKFLLHTGLPRTASTAIQHWLDLTTFTLERYGIYVPPSQTPSLLKSLCSGNGYYIYEILTRNSEPMASLDRLLIQLSDAAEAARCNTILLSSEYFSMLDDDGTRLLFECVAKQDPNFCCIHLLRDPYAWWISSWAQSIRYPGNSKWLYDSLIENLDYNLRPLLFLERASTIKGGRARIHTLDFDAHKAKLSRPFIDLVARLSSVNFTEDIPPLPRVNSALSAVDLLCRMTACRLSAHDKNLTACLAQASDDYPSTTNRLEVRDDRAYDILVAFCKAHSLSLAAPSSNGFRSIEEVADSLTPAESILFANLRLSILYAKNVRHDFLELINNRIKTYKNSPYKSHAPDGFFIAEYLLLNHDVLYADIDPYQHYHEFGRNEPWRITAFSPVTVSATAEISLPPARILHPG